MTLAEVERAIADLQPAARAEKEYGPGKRNPWAGSSEKLSALEKQREKMRGDLARERIENTLDAYERARKDLADASAAYAKAIRERAEYDNSLVILRYRNAASIARRHGVGMRFEGWQAWFESGRHENMMRPDERPTAQFPEACRFNENDRKIVHAWLAAKNAELIANNARDAATQRLTALEREHPELRAAKVA